MSVTPPPAPATMPVSAHHQRMVELATIVGLDVLTGIVAALFGHGIGRQVAQWFRASRSATAQPATATGTPVTPTPADPTDPTIHTLPFGIGAKDEGEAGMTLGNTFWAQRKKLAKLFKVVGFIANKLNQAQRDLLREAVGHIKTAELQMEFWRNLALASRNEKSFMNFMKAMGVVRDVHEFSDELGKAISSGLAQSNTYHKQIVKRESTRLNRRLRAALRP